MPDTPAPEQRRTHRRTSRPRGSQPRNLCTQPPSKPRTQSSQHQVPDNHWRNPVGGLEWRTSRRRGELPGCRRLVETRHAPLCVDTEYDDEARGSVEPWHKPARRACPVERVFGGSALSTMSPLAAPCRLVVGVSSASHRSDTPLLRLWQEKGLLCRPFCMGGTCQCANDVELDAGRLAVD
jgi:hypothetical protein